MPMAVGDRKGRCAPQSKRSLGASKLKLYERAKIDRKLTSATDYKVLIHLGQIANERGIAHHRIEDIAEAVGRDRKYVGISIHRLQDRGYIRCRGRYSKKARNGEGGQISNSYELCFNLDRAADAAVYEPRRAAKAKVENGTPTKKKKPAQCGGIAPRNEAKSPHPMGRNRHPYSPYPFPTSSLGEGVENATAPPAHEGRSWSLGETLNGSSGGNDSLHSGGSGNGNGVKGETEKSKSTNRLLEAQSAFIKKSGCGVDALRQIEVGERISFRPVEDQIAFWQERAAQ